MPAGSRRYNGKKTQETHPSRTQSGALVRNDGFFVVSEEGIGRGLADLKFGHYMYPRCRPEGTALQA